jgi:hypothetical protein
MSPGQNDVRVAARRELSSAGIFVSIRDRNAATGQDGKLCIPCFNFPACQSVRHRPRFPHRTK